MNEFADFLENILGRFQRRAPGSSKLDFGDVVGVNRGVYCHYGVCAGPDSIIHYSSESSDTGADATIRETSLSAFLRDQTALFKLFFPENHDRPIQSAPFNPLSMIVPPTRRVNPAYRLYSPEETVVRARSRLGERHYNLLLNNCEHFAIWCKTGVSESWQVNRMLELFNTLPSLKIFVS